jgi:ABC-type amino acid transport substrate-binding protein
MKTARPLAIGAIAALLLAGAATWMATRSGTAKQSTVAQFTSQGVTVTITVKDRAESHATIVATFAPQKPGFHLYSADLPATGIQGVGRPIKVVPQGKLHGTGPLTADAKILMLPLAGTDLTLPVYPDGPVAAELPVALDGDGNATLLVSYAACSSNNCLPPVTDHPIDLQVSASGITERA